MAVLGRSRSGPPPPDQILDPPLAYLKCATQLMVYETIVP